MEALLKTTFDQLPADQQDALVKIEQVIQKQDHLCEEIAQHSFSPISKMRNKMKSVDDVLNGIKEAIAEDSKRVQEFYHQVSKQLKEADQQLRTSARCGNTSQQPTIEIPSKFFWALLGEFENRMQTYKHQIDDIENALRAPSNVPGDISIIGEIVTSNNETFFSVASKVAELHRRLQNTKRELVKQLGEDPFKNRKALNGGYGISKTEEILFPPVPLNAATPNNNTSTNTFGTPLGSTTSTFGAQTPSTTSSSGFGGFGSTASTGTSSSLFGTKTASPAVSFGQSTPTSSTGSSFGGFGSTSSTGSTFGSTSSGTTSFGSTTGSGTFGTSFGSNTPLASLPAAKKSASGSLLRRST